MVEFGLYGVTVLTYYLGDAAILGGVNPLQFDEGLAILLSFTHLFTWMGCITAEFVVHQEFFVASVILGYILALAADVWAVFARLTAETLPAGATVRLVISFVLAGLALFQIVANAVRARQQRRMVREFIKLFGETEAVIATPREAGNRRLMQQLYRAKRLPKTTLRWIRRVYRLSVIRFTVVGFLVMAFLFGFYPSFGVRVAPVLLFVGHVCIWPFEIAVSRAAVGRGYPPPIVRGTPGIVLTCVFYTLMLLADVAGTVFHVALSILRFSAGADIGLIGLLLRWLPWVWLAFLLFLILFGVRSGWAAFVVQRRLRDQGALQIKTRWAD